MLKDLSRDELELMSYSDVAYIILKEEKKELSTKVIFDTLCDLFEENKENYELLGDLFSLLSNDKRFILRDSGNFDLKERNKVVVILEDDLDELDNIDDIIDDEELIDEDEEVEEIIEEEIDELDNDIDANLADDDFEDDLESLTIIDEEDAE